MKNKDKRSWRCKGNDNLNLAFLCVAAKAETSGGAYKENLINVSCEVTEVRINLFIHC